LTSTEGCAPRHVGPLTPGIRGVLDAHFRAKPKHKKS
jgi:hypothetical protein